MIDFYVFEDGEESKTKKILERGQITHLIVPPQNVLLNEVNHARFPELDIAKEDRRRFAVATEPINAETLSATSYLDFLMVKSNRVPGLFYFNAMNLLQVPEGRNSSDKVILAC